MRDIEFDRFGLSSLKASESGMAGSGARDVRAFV